MLSAFGIPLLYLLRSQNVKVKWMLSQFKGWFWWNFSSSKTFLNYMQNATKVTVTTQLLYCKFSTRFERENLKFNFERTVRKNLCLQSKVYNACALTFISMKSSLALSRIDRLLFQCDMSMSVSRSLRRSLYVCLLSWALNAIAMHPSIKIIHS